MASVFKPKGSRKYVILWYDENGKRHKQTGCTDKAESERIGADLENRKALRAAGLVDGKAEGYRDHEAAPVSAHLAAWVKSLEAKGASPKHIDLFSGRAARVVALVGGARLKGIEPAKVTRDEIARAEAELSRWVQAARLSGLTHDRVQAALAKLKAEGRALATCNHHRTAIRSFSKWLYESHRTREDNLRGVKGFNAREDRRHDRRTISLEELRNLIEAAHIGPDFQAMTGPARAICYRLAVASGLRYSELTSLTSRSFNLEAPEVTVLAAYSKNGQTATLPLPNDLADDLATFLTMLAPEAPVFPLAAEKGAEMLRVDLAAAGIPYRDAGGLVFDFHALRCQCATLADAAGVTPRVVQKMMRHSTLELTGRYTRPRAVDMEQASGMLPSLKRQEREPAIQAQTGTDFQPIATENATDDGGTARNPMPRNMVMATFERSHNPQVMSSSPVPGICSVELIVQLLRFNSWFVEHLQPLGSRADGRCVRALVRCRTN